MATESEEAAMETVKAETEEEDMVTEVEVDTETEKEEVAMETEVEVAMETEVAVAMEIEMERQEEDLRKIIASSQEESELYLNYIKVNYI